ncbi:hypothetical protein M422DRAFT_33806 [Sphaerobolus stellatus SS14]|uniref:Unplaced genomic scaffold SPHSTscaffold_95, whole genome shotgun sequence n=1 Tax=Sphaerobolus stellatus (strain SS14) TaxID=990650 RepID=A0A0C9UR61_SPHS4|nr:hypothetical protein M422DRAFT_33806 [Sphaerobolus stellatus SS14]
MSVRYLPIQFGDELAGASTPASACFLAGNTNPSPPTGLIPIHVGYYPGVHHPAPYSNVIAVRANHHGVPSHGLPSNIEYGRFLGGYQPAHPQDERRSREENRRAGIIHSGGSSHGLVSQLVDNRWVLEEFQPPCEKYVSFNGDWNNVDGNESGS